MSFNKTKHVSEAAGNDVIKFFARVRHAGYCAKFQLFGFFKGHTKSKGNIVCYIRSSHGKYLD